MRESINRLAKVERLSELEALDRLLRTDAFRSSRNLVHKLFTQGWDIITVLCAHPRMVNEYAGDFDALVFRIGCLIDGLHLTPDDTGYYPSLEAHLMAEKAYKGQPDRSAVYPKPYTQQDEIVALVESNTATVPQVIEYLSARLWTNPDKEDYLDYLSQHALKDGWL